MTQLITTTHVHKILNRGTAVFRVFGSEGKIERAVSRFRMRIRSPPKRSLYSSRVCWSRVFEISMNRLLESGRAKQCRTLLPREVYIILDFARSYKGLIISIRSRDEKRYQNEGTQ